MMTVLYLCDDPMEGILIMLRQKLSGELAYLVYTRKKDPIPLYHGVRTALQALSLNPKDFNIKSRDYGTVWIEFNMYRCCVTTDYLVFF